MFYECNDLISLNLTSFNTQNVISMDWMFYGCQSLTELNLSTFDTSNVDSMAGMFRNCYLLTTLNLSSFDTENLRTTTSMFDYCQSLKTIYIGEQWTMTNVESSLYMFDGCTNLTNFNTSYTDKTYAHAGEGGYLTYKSEE